MRRNATKRFLLWTVVMVVLIAALAMGVEAATGTGGREFSMGMTGYQYDNGDEYRPGGGTAGAQAIRDLDIHWVSGTVRVEVHDGKSIEFVESADRVLSDKEMMHTRVQGDRLSIQFAKSGRGFTFDSPAGKALTVRIPRGTSLRTLGIENVSSQVYVAGEGLTVQALDVESVSGAVDVSGVYGRELTLETVSGDVQVDGGFESVDAEGISGRQTYRLHAPLRTLDAESVSGDIMVYVPQSLGFVAELESMSGRIHSSHAAVEGRFIAYHGDREAQMDFETLSGSVTIEADAALEARAEEKPAKPQRPDKAATPAPTGGVVPVSQRSF